MIRLQEKKQTLLTRWIICGVVAVIVTQFCRSPMEGICVYAHMYIHMIVSIVCNCALECTVLSMYTNGYEAQKLSGTSVP